MTRKEQIYEAAIHSRNARTNVKTFMKGAEWADKNPKPIDWEKIWENYKEDPWLKPLIEKEEKRIQQLVEKQLESEE